MEPTALLNADYLDIIFDKRNKTYGGYELRRNYDSRMKKAGGFVILSVAGLFGIFLLTAARDGQPLLKPTCVLTLTDIKTILPPVVLPKIIPPPPSPPPAQTKANIFTPPKIVDKDIPPESMMTPVKDMHNAQPGLANTTGDSTGISSVPATEHGNGTSVASLSSNASGKPMIIVDQMPEFAGNMGDYLNKHLRYPDAAREQGIEGRVVIEFVVNEDGTVTSARVARSIGGGCDEEALRIVNSMPKWKPGKQNGMPVKVLFTLPIKFVLSP